MYLYGCKPFFHSVERKGEEDGMVLRRTDRRGCITQQGERERERERGPNALVYQHHCDSTFGMLDICMCARAFSICLSVMTERLSCAV